MVARIERRVVVPRVDTLDRLLEACGEGLYAFERMGIGVDKTLAEESLRDTVGERVEAGVATAENFYRFTSEFRRSANVVREGMRTPPTQVDRILEVLGHHDVRFVVIGGTAAVAQGAPIVTFDLDICYDRDEGNIRRLVHALKEMHASLRGAPKDLPDVIDEKLIRNGLNFSFQTVFGSLDCVGEPAGVGGYRDLLANATTGTVFGIEVNVAGISDLIRMKRAAGRPKDRAHVEELGALQEIIDERARRERDS